MDPRHEITELLVELRGGNADAMDRLVPLVYGELQRIAHRQLGHERASGTLCTTALVHEAYLKLVEQRRAEWTDRTHFLAIAARVMRRIVVDHARKHRTAKRGSARPRLSLDDVTVPVEERADLLVELDEALTRLGGLDERLARVVECRFFAGLTEEETAEVLHVTPRTVRRDWVKAKGWLYQELSAGTAD
jgi:RNA polymerase sigma factor (TIGR02999 family)